MKKRFIKSLAALSSAVMLFGAVAQPVDYSFKFSSNNSIMTADAATYPTGAYGGKISYQCADGAWIYFDYVYDNGEKAALEVSGSYFTKEAYISIPATKSFQGKTYKVVGIKANAFKGQKNLANISGGANLKYIGNSAFENCTALNSVYGLSKSSEGKANLESIGNNAFKNCSKIVNINSLVDTKVIGDYAFDGCKSLKEICLSKECTSIGKYAFANCTSITKIDLSQSSITTIPDYAFYNNWSAVEITLPKGLTSIGSSAFAYCSELTTIIIPETTTTIGSSAFFCCSELTTIIIPEATNTIGSSAFLSCNNLKNYVWKNSNSRANVGTYTMGYATSRTGPVKLSGVTVWGYGGIAAQYATYNGFTYKNISNAASESEKNMLPYVFGILNKDYNFGKTVTNTYGTTEFIETIIDAHKSYYPLYEDRAVFYGNCVGIAAVSVLARNGYLDVKKITGNKYSKLSDIKDNGKDNSNIPDITASLINVLQQAQTGSTTKIKFFTPKDINDIERITYGEDVCELDYNNGQGGHALVCYGIEYREDAKDRDTNADWKIPKEWGVSDVKHWDARILIYDTNDGAITDKHIYVNLTDSENLAYGSWRARTNTNKEWYNYHYKTKNNTVSSGYYFRLRNDYILNRFNNNGVSILRDFGCTHPSL